MSMFGTVAPMFGWPKHTVIMTACGPYEPSEMEVDAFRSVYSGEVGKYDPRWMEELVIYASKQTEAEYVESVR